MRMFLTRLGMGSKVVVTGDPTQVDLPRDSLSGLVEASRILQNVPDIGIIEFDRTDVVRHKLVQRIVEAYRISDEDTIQ
jgi:phosphate starvation-inducible PhoH-like protein